jgi:anthranilate synthase/aminodeoxychorismate synthase-like glutamine amidotransferase
MILLLDNYDSFTWNLYDYLAQCGAEVKVHRNDAISVSDIKAMQPQGIVISPGPETPSTAGITMELIAACATTFPMLGVCLGYQAIGMHFGAELVASPVPMHGKTSRIVHNGSGLFEGIKSPMEVMRYHSLQLRNFPNELELLAETENGEPMAIRHQNLPLFGVQFHPESILTTEGIHLLQNWWNSLQTV